MSTLNPDLRNFLTGALGYLAGAAAGFSLIFIIAQLRLLRRLIDLIDQSQYLIQILAIPILIGMALALGGAVLGGLGGWALASILGIARKRRQVIGSGIAFAVAIGAMSLVFLLLIGFIGVYNNFTANRIEQYGIIFGVFGLVFGLLAGILQAFTSLRLKHTWRVILAATIGFALGGVVTGLLVRLVNPIAGFKTYPILTGIGLILAALFPFALGGGALGFTYGRLARRVTAKGETVESLQPTAWQTGIVAALGILAALWLFGVMDNITDFLTIRPANSETQIAPETIGVSWSAALPYTADVSLFEPVAEGQSPVVVAGDDQVVHKAWCDPQGKIGYQQGSGATEQIDFPGCQGAPAMALDSANQPHLVWYTSEIRDTNGMTRADSLLVESIRTADG